jgi:hypothetical protein
MRENKYGFRIADFGLRNESQSHFNRKVRKGVAKFAKKRI